MVNNDFSEKLVNGLFRPSINSVDLMMLFLMIFIFSNPIVWSLLFIVYFLFVSRAMTRHLGFVTRRNG